MSNNDLKTTEFNNIQMDEKNTPILPIEEEEIEVPIIKKKGRPVGSKKPRPVLIPDPIPVPVVEIPPPKIMCDAETQTEVGDFQSLSANADEEEEVVPCIDCAKKRSKKDNPNYWKEYYAEHKSKLLQQKKDWRDKNKDKVNSVKRKEYQKEYDSKHKEQIKARRERLITCECGEELKHYSLLNHRKKSKTHTLKIQLKIAKGEIIVPVAEMTEEDTSSDTSSLSGGGSAEEEPV
jgi:hypothetical protein